MPVPAEVAARPSTLCLNWSKLIDSTVWLSLGRRLVMSLLASPKAGFAWAVPSGCWSPPSSVPVPGSPPAPGPPGGVRPAGAGFVPPPLADFLSPPEKRMTAPTIRPMTAVRPSAPATIRTTGAPPLFFLAFGLSSSSAAPLRPGLSPFAPAFITPDLPPDLAPALAPTFSTAGASTTKRYLHFGHSTFLPTRLSSLIGTWNSQLGHCCLKPAIRDVSAGGRRYVWRRDGNKLSMINGIRPRMQR